MKTYEVAGATPINKVMNSTLAGAIILIVVYLLHQFAGVDLPTEISAALTTIIMSLVAYLTPIAPGEIKPIAESGS